ncbi:alpha/beta hydrolase [Microbacterium sp. SL75]|uniref:alpha/beta hydrolase n=1 Tax=Microbacterium sp. SL75 TaxID=2995140 RepID=UPI00226F5169|nr:alpha/beta hydrolase [Microbacterium sp. SL75]WAC68517.1 alpha/beta hydrolase [Microbacterium sp. SL75]
MLIEMSNDPDVLIPGSLGDITTSAASWRELGRRANDVAASLRRLPLPEGWSGQASLAYEAHVAEQAKHWELLAESLTAAAGVLQEYSSTLAWAKDQARLAIEKWRAASAAEAANPILSPTTQADELRRGAWAILQHAEAELNSGGERAALTLEIASSQPEIRDETWARIAAPVTTPQEALELTKSLSGPELTAVLSARPEIAAFLQRVDASTIHSWWTELDGAQHDALVATIPQIIGNLEGVAYEARDVANRNVLNQKLATARAALAQAEQPLPWFPPPTQGQVNAHVIALDAARDQLAALEQVSDSLATDPASGVPRSLVSLSSDDPPLAAVSIGNLDTATNVTYAVPGMGSSALHMQDWAASAQNLQTAQMVVDPAHEQAVVAWVGYKSPPIPVQQGGLDVLDTTLAVAGAKNLDNALAGFHATRGEAALNVVAHSYGTTTASIAVSESSVRVDSFVSLGSAGLPPEINEASDLNAAHVFAGQAVNVSPLAGEPGDQWAWTGRFFGNHPVDPSAQAFGAHRFGVDTPDSGLTPVDDHNTSSPTGGGYLDAQTESLRNVALATTGQGNLTSAYVRPW